MTLRCKGMNRTKRICGLILTLLIFPALVTNAYAHTSVYESGYKVGKQDAVYDLSNPVGGCNALGGFGDNATQLQIDPCDQGYDDPYSALDHTSVYESGYKVGKQDAVYDLSNPVGGCSGFADIGTQQEIDTCHQGYNDAYNYFCGIHGHTPSEYTCRIKYSVPSFPTATLLTAPRYIWQFADKDVKRIRFKFDKVYQAIDKFSSLWKAQVSPDITGYCPTCPLKDPCLGWHFARSDKLSFEDVARRRAAFNLSKIREEISDTDRWKVYVSIRNAEERHQDGWALTGLKLATSEKPINQQIVFTSAEDRPFGNFIDFSVGDFVTISDGNPNLESNPTAIITNIDLERSSVTLQSIRNDLYVLTYDNRQTATVTMDRFDFDKGLTNIRYLDSFFRNSPYADRIRQGAAV
jgi:hypothetical protein